MMNLKIDQVAVTTQHPQSMITRYRSMGVDDWTLDRVTAKGVVCGRYGSNIANLWFSNKVMPGLQFEILQYTAGRNWLEERKQREGLSHFGMHVYSIDGYIEANPILMTFASELQRVETTHHTAFDNRHYQYLILDTRNVLGADLKLIQRVDHDKAQA